MMRKAIGENVSLAGLININDQPVSIPQDGKYTHLQFRRFAGCPVCNLHLQSFFRREDELKANNVHEVIVFHASKRSMLESVIDVPFDLIADPSRTLYKNFGVESSWKALFSCDVVKKAIKGIRKFGVKPPQSLEAELGLPADFLLDETGNILAVNYGTHADDQWSVDDVLGLLPARKSL
ncbi:redoxin domain-containing protein [Marinobacter mobilis]|uniref:Peroxiredoxin n=1 Tax=Marinobacter mobilis TaxID=488533 RepID=A0A1H2WKT1_9GAMM|nr:redoxin domain-containing protein [Marinobacter mobilis]SDW81240.1 Peroxiredoxin [Marinobacter mobilis]